MKEKQTINNTMWERYKINERIKEKYENKQQKTQLTDKKNILKSNKEMRTK